MRLKSAAAKTAAKKKKAPAKKKKGGGGGGGGGMRAQSGKSAAAKKQAAAKGNVKALTPRQQAAKYLASAVKETARAAREAARAAVELERAKAQQERAEGARRAAVIAGVDSARGRRLAAEEATDLKRAVNDRARAKKERSREATAKARAAADRVAAHDALIGAASPGAVADGWILGWNDDLDTCAAAALANSLLACTGHRVSDREVLDLYLATTRGRDQLVSLGTTLDAARELGLGGWHPVRPGSNRPDGDGTIVVLPGHAAVRWRGGLVSWGRWDAASEPPGADVPLAWAQGSRRAGP